jgi:dTDP-4-dehydrorhamnose reductase
MQNKRVLITGASGFVGWNAVRTFAESGAEIIATSRSLPHYLQTSGVLSVELDLADGSAIDQVVARFQPAFILHAAAITRPQQSVDDTRMHAINVEAARRLAEAAQRHGSGIVLLSTDLVYPADAGVCDEQTPVNPSGAGLYSHSKLQAEQEARSCEKWIVLRPSLMFGVAPPGGNSFSRFIEEHWARNEPAPLFTDQYRSFLYVGDLCAAVELVTRGHGAWGETFVCGGPERMSRAEFGARFARTTGRDQSLVQAMRSTELPGYIGGPSDISLDCGKLISLGWRPRVVEEGFREMQRLRVQAG